jgi:diaminopimelate epimerase
MPVTFEKMHGAGNDFVLLDLREQPFELNAALAAQLADRHTGIGCDQLLVLRTPASPDHLVRFEVWNADGSRAEQCGNGVRCIGLYLEMRGEAPDHEYTIEGPVAPVRLQGLGDGQFRASMGVPDFRPGAVPVHLPPSGDGFELQIGEQQYAIGAVSMGNPHAVLQVPDLAAAPVATLGPLISAHQGFPRGCNAGFVEIVDRGQVRLRVFERGAGETRACGSGACAAAAVLMRNGSLDPQVLVKQVGGDLIIEWTGEGEPIMMTGPAMHVYKGVLL